MSNPAPTPADIAADPAWMPHTIDRARRAVQFQRIPRATLGEPGFLADRTPATPADACWVSFDDVAAMQPATGPLHFIFHTAFCRSTLLVRALNHPGLAAGLAEPRIIVALVNAGEDRQRLAGPLLDLLSRAGEGEQAVFVKPTNHANAVVPLLMDTRPDARAVLMTNPLPSFLNAVMRKGLMGRRWGRQLYAEMQGYAGMDFGMPPAEVFAMTDMQAAGLAWFLNQRFLAQLADRYGDRVRVLDGDRFDTARAETIRALADFTTAGGQRRAGGRHRHRPRLHHPRQAGRQLRRQGHRRHQAHAERGGRRGSGAGGAMGRHDRGAGEAGGAGAADVVLVRCRAAARFHALSGSFRAGF